MMRLGGAFSILVALGLFAGCGSGDGGPGDGGVDEGVDMRINPFDGICRTCTTDGDCLNGMTCITFGSGRACTPACDTASSLCPTSFFCTELNDPLVTGTFCGPRVGNICCVDDDGDLHGIGDMCAGTDCDEGDPNVHSDVEEICGNSVDDDCDGMTDEPTTETCLDGADNDCDSQADCSDTDCAGDICGADQATCMNGTCGCTRTSESVCDDSEDTDCDGMIDCADPDCNGEACGGVGNICFSATECRCATGMTEMFCSNGMDDNCDGFIDCEDPGCDMQRCGTNGRTCTGNACVCPGGNTENSCQNGIDDDCDAEVDCDDPDCATQTCAPFGRVCSGTTCACPGGNGPETDCGDRADNDCDGATDCTDRMDCMNQMCGPSQMCASDGTCPCGGFVELCEGSNDDDCNGTVDNGCPEAVLLGTPLVATTGRGGTGGGAMTLTCPTGQALVGFNGRADDSGNTRYLVRIEPVCAPIVLTATPGTPEDAFTATWTAAGAPLGVAGGPDGSGQANFTERCPMNQFVAGIRGRYGNLSGDGFSTIVLQFGFVCAPVTVQRLAGGGTWEITRGAIDTANQHLHGTTSMFTAITDDCPANHIAMRVGNTLTGTSSSLAEGDRVDRVGITCAPLTLDTI